MKVVELYSYMEQFGRVNKTAKETLDSVNDIMVFSTNAMQGDRGTNGDTMIVYSMQVSGKIKVAEIDQFSKKILKDLTNAIAFDIDNSGQVNVDYLLYSFNVDCEGW